MKKVCAFVLIFVLLLSSISMPASASTYEKGSWIVTKEGLNLVLKNIETGEEIVSVYRLDEAGNFIEVDLYDCAKIFNNIDDVAETLCNPLVGNFGTSAEMQRLSVGYTYKQESSYQTYGTTVKVSPSVVGPATVTTGEAATITDSYGGSVSISSTIKKKSKPEQAFLGTVACKLHILFHLPSPYLVEKLDT